MKTLDIKAVVKILNRYFSTSVLIFEESDGNNILPTINTRIRPDKYVMNDQFAPTDKFRPELLEVLKKCGITDVTFNNTGHTFWWTEVVKKHNPITGEEIIPVKEEDIKFWDKTWEELTLDEKAMFCSFAKISYLATKGEFNNEKQVKDAYNAHKLKHTFYY